MYIHRELEGLLKEAYKYFKVISLTGPRQSGKSTTLKELFPDAERYTMKDLSVRDFALRDPKAFLNSSEKPMFIDEVQKVPELLEYIQTIVDEDPSHKFILSGSSNFELMKDISESLAGRAGVYELLPMSLGEIRGQKTADRQIDEILFSGFYPDICAGNNIPSLFYPAYVRTYVERDIRDVLKIKDTVQFTRFLKMCAARIGSIFNANEISNSLGIDNKTVSAWLSALAACYIVYLLPPYYENISKRLVKSPKLYFTDTGLAAYLLDIETPQQLARDKMRGPLFENMVVIEALKRRLNIGKTGGLFFYRDSSGTEVDLVLKEAGELQLFEIKSSSTYSETFEKSLRKLPQYLRTPINNRTVVYNGDFENTSGEIRIVNWRNLQGKGSFANGELF